MEISGSTHIACPPEVLSRVLDGEAVVLDLASGTYFGMNEVATRAWELIMSGTRFDALVHSLQAEFEVGSEDLERDMRDFLEKLREQKLVTLTSA